MNQLRCSSSSRSSFDLLSTQLLKFTLCRRPALSQLPIISHEESTDAFQPIASVLAAREIYRSSERQEGAARTARGRTDERLIAGEDVAAE